MSRKTRPSAGQNRNRGRHKKWKSRETRKWLRMFGHLPSKSAPVQATLKEEGARSEL